MKQKAGLSAIDYMACVKMEARRAGIEGDQLRCVIIQGLLPNTRQFVVASGGDARQRGISSRGKGKKSPQECVAVTVGK